MKYFKLFLRVVIIGWLIYCLYSAYPYPLDSSNWLNEDFSANIPNIIGTYLIFFIIFGVAFLVVGIVLFGLNWIFENKNDTHAKNI